MSLDKRTIRLGLVMLTLSALAFTAIAGGVRESRAAAVFPNIPSWALVGAFQDSTRIDSFRCAGSFQGIPDDSLREQARTVSFRFLRDRRAEARPDFGGYRIYRMVSSPDSNFAVLLRRYSRNAGSEMTWNASILDTASMQYICQGGLAYDSVLTFVDPDSSGQYQKVCSRSDPRTGVCTSPGDSTFRLVPPPGPHDGFLTWYSVTYEKKNTTDTNYEDLFVPDTLDNFVRCGVPGVPGSCPNLNNKLRNLSGPVTPTGGPTADLEGVRVVPNPYRGTETWDQPGQNEIHFINLPQTSTIKIYTVAGDLVRTIQHSDAINDFERWDLKSDGHKTIASGIYIYRVEATVGATPFTFQSRFVVIR